MKKKTKTKPTKMKKKNKTKEEKTSHSLIHLPNVSIHVLHTFFYTFPKLLTRRLSWTIKSFFSGKSFPLLLWNWLLFIVVVEWYYKFVLLSHDKVTWCRMLCHNQPYNAVPQPVDPIAWRRLTVGSRNVAFYIKWPCRETTEQTYDIISFILVHAWKHTWVNHLTPNIAKIKIRKNRGYDVNC